MVRDRLNDIVAYICAAYPQKSELSSARLTKLVYLADWQSARLGEGQLTEIDWIFNHYGPWVPDVMEAAEEDSRLRVIEDTNYYGSPRKRVEPDEGLGSPPALDQRTRILLDKVIAETRHMYFGEFIEHVYKTPPVVRSPRGSHLDLITIAAEEGPAETLPSIVEDAQISAEDFAALAEAVSSAASQLLLSDTWETEAEPGGVITAESFIVPDLDIDSLSLTGDPAFVKVTRSTWKGSISGTADASVLVERRDAAENDNYESDGYFLEDDDWDDWYVLIGRQFDCSFEFEVTRSSGSFSVKMLRVVMS